MTSHGHTAMGVSKRAGTRGPPRRLRTTCPPLGSRGNANSLAACILAACILAAYLSGACLLSSLPLNSSQAPGLDPGPPSREAPPLACCVPASLPRARASHLSSAVTPPSRSHMFMRSASLPSISRFRLTLRFHRSSRRMRRCSTAMRVARADNSVKRGSRLSSDTTSSTASSSTPMRAHRAPTSLSPSCGGAFQSVMRQA